MSDTETHELITDQAGREASGARYGRYLEEFEVGAVYRHWPAKTVTEADDHLFCLITMNHHPHINDVHASQSQQGRNVVVGPLVYSLAVGMTVSDVSGKAIANLATEELSHPNPVFHGDTLYCESRCSRCARHSQARPRGREGPHTRVQAGWLAGRRVQARGPGAAKPEAIEDGASGADGPVEAGAARQTPIADVGRADPRPWRDADQLAGRGRRARPALASSRS